MAQQFNVKDWLNEFLAKRKLNKPDGRHLFSYRATPDEFLSLEEGLKQLVDASRLHLQNPLELWKGIHEFNAAFVLYAALGSTKDSGSSK